MGEMNKVRLGIAGMGNIGKFHADYLLQGKVNRCELAAVSSTSPARLEPYRQLKTFENTEKMIRSGVIDALIIATPHYQHTTLGIEALQHGIHVLVEKPISVHKADCERLIAAHRDSKVVFAAVFQQRAEPKYKKLKSLLMNRELGEITRFNWIMTDWFRTEAYYSSGGWRATWKGEGGGALLNQCPHNLDMLIWLMGRPSRVRGFCELGRFHDIEVEDNVTAYLEWPNRATGVFITSTGETPGSNRLEIVGERGKIVVENHRISFTRNETSMFDFSKTSKVGFARPEVWNIEVPYENAAGQHQQVTQNFVDAILDGTPLIAPGSDGIHSVELANAILYSSLESRTIDMPLDSAAYERKLQQLISESKMEKKTVKSIVGEDFTKSFNR
jgi:predicted dehydrogenase